MSHCQAPHDFLLGQLASCPPSLCFQPPREIRNGRNHQNFISVTASQVAGPLVDKNRMRGVARVWEETRKGQNSQSRILGNSPALSVPRGTRFFHSLAAFLPESCALIDRSKREYKCLIIYNLQKENTIKFRALATVVLYVTGLCVFRFTLHPRKNNANRLCHKVT